MIRPRPAFRRLAGGAAAAALLLGSAASIQGVHAAAPTSDNIGTPMFKSLHGLGTGNASTVSSRFDTIPAFKRSFSYGGTTYPYQMVGTDPYMTNTTTTVQTPIYTLKVVFSNGVVLNGARNVPNVLHGPDFQSTKYSSGYTQFGDAVQRATFWNAVQNKNWHVLINPSSSTTQIELHVPAQYGETVVGSHTGRTLGLIDFNWFYPTLLNALESMNVDVHTFPIVLAYDTFLYFGDPSQCCVLGYHDAVYDGAVNANGTPVLTYAFASWNEGGIFSTTDVADVHALSHEISEWMNDPFTDNVVPNWTAPTAQPGSSCGNYLETGDPLTGQAYPLILNNYVYHPQNEALLPWFEKQQPSTAINHAYSYPDISLFTHPAATC